MESRIEALESSPEGVSTSDYLEYLGVLPSIAEQLGVAKELFDELTGGPEERFHLARAEAAVLAAEIRVQQADYTSVDDHTVRLSKPVQEELLAECDRLAKLFKEADLPAEQFRRVQSKLDELKREVGGGNLSHSTLARLVGVIAVAGTLGLAGSHFTVNVTQSMLNIAAIKQKQEDANEEKARQLAAPDMPALISLPPKPFLLPSPEDK